KGKKQPFYIHRPDNGPFAFAGLWEKWTARDASDGASPATGEDRARPLTIESCAIVTTEANKSLSELHNRMPVVLASCDYENWLNAKVDNPAAFQHLLVPCGEEELIAEPVGTYVNRVANDDPHCIAVQRSLF